MTTFPTAIETLPRNSLSKEDLQQIIALCRSAYNEELQDLLTSLNNPLHVIIRSTTRIISHACIIERWLQNGEAPPMRAAYIEAVCTAPELQSHGYASQIMQRVVVESERLDFNVAALCTGRFGFYERLGWERWRGALSYRRDGELVPCPEEEGVMVYHLAKTPPLTLSVPLSVEWREGEVW